MGMGMASPHGHGHGGSELGMAAPRLVIIAEFQVKAECVEECARVLRESARGSRAEPGCVRFDVLRDQTDPCRRAQCTLHALLAPMLAWLGLAPLLTGHHDSVMTASLHSAASRLGLCTPAGRPARAV